MQFDLKRLTQFAQAPNNAWVWFILTLLTISLFTTFSPAEHSLGTHIRVVYLHGAWVWASLAAYLTAGVFGGLGLLTQRKAYHSWSRAFGWSGLIFWITYLPLSLWAMQSNWNGLFLAEPRWRLALIFAITGILLQVGLSLADKPGLTSALNLCYFIALIFALQQTPNVMHPAFPILNTDVWRIQIFFLGLVSLSLLAVWQMARWWYKSEPDGTQR
jgi:hypothetical protein